MINITVREEIKSVCPEFVGACVEAHVVNTPYNQPLWDEINALGDRYRGPAAGNKRQSDAPAAASAAESGAVIKRQGSQQ